MADYGAVYTDKEIAKLDKQIQSIYKEAEKDINVKMKSFVAKSKAKEQKYQQQVKSGQMTQKEFDKWKAGQVFQGKQWQAKKDEILETIHNSNIIATKMINGESINVFATNANYMSYDLEHGIGVNFGFSLYDSNAVTNLIKNDPQLLPQWKINKPKDYKWSQKKLNRSITQGIIQGESLDKIANRLSDKLASTNASKMKTFARTAMTGAQNSGRQMQLENAKNLGIELMKEWMATLDAHTRDSHKDLDGEQVEVDKEFSNGLMYPGDPGGPPAETYNCRCTMVSDVKKYPSIYNRYDNITRDRIKNMSYRDWEKAKKTGGNLKPYTVDKIALGDLFAGLSQNGAYVKIHDVSVALSNQFYKELQEMSAAYPEKIGAAQVWKDYLNGNLPSGVSEKKLEDLMKQYKDKALGASITFGKSVLSPVKAPKTAPAKSIPKAKNAQKKTFESTDSWLRAARNNPDIDRMLSLEKKSFRKFTKEEVDALKTYTGSSYWRMNGYLRNRAAGMSEAEALRAARIHDPWLVEQIELCQSALSKSKLEHDLVLRRGTDFGDLAGLFMQGDFDHNSSSLRGKSAEALNKMFQGSAGKYVGFTSTSSQWDRGFSGEVEVIIYAPKGSEAASIMEISQFGTSEGETLLNAGTKVVCEKIEESDGHFESDIRVFLRIIP